MEEIKENDEKFNDYMAVRIVAHDHYMHTIRNPTFYHYDEENGDESSKSKGQNRVTKKMRDQLMDIQYSDFMKRHIDKVPVTRIFGKYKS
jgi:hypothetical protein